MPYIYLVTKSGGNKFVENIETNSRGVNKSRYRSLNLTNTLDLGFASLTSLTSYDFSNSAVKNADGDFTFAPTTGLNVLVYSDAPRKTFAQELRLSNFANGQDFKWLFGVYYSHDKSLANSGYLADFGPGGIIPLSDGDSKDLAKTYAFFGQASYEIGKLELSAGIRYDKEKRDSERDLTSFLPVVTTSAASRKASFKAWQPKVSASYKFSPDAMVYALVARGFRSGGFNSVDANPGDETFQPEYTWNYELGAKTELFDRRVRLNTALFYIEYSNRLLAVLTPGRNGPPIVVSRNQGSARSYGIEIEAAARLTEQLTLSGGYGYTNAKSKTLQGDITRDFQYIPRSTFNVQADYGTPLTDDVALNLRAGVSYKGRMNYGQRGGYRDPVTLVDGAIDLTFDERYTVSVFAKNLFNKGYYMGYLSADYVAPVGVDGALGLLARTREVGVRLTASF